MASPAVDCVPSVDNAVSGGGGGGGWQPAWMGADVKGRELSTMGTGAGQGFTSGGVSSGGVPRPPRRTGQRFGRRSGVGGQGRPPGGIKAAFVTPTETNVHGDALCYMAKTRARHKTTETGLNNGWRLAVGSWRLAVLGGCP